MRPKNARAAETNALAPAGSARSHCTAQTRSGPLAATSSARASFSDCSSRPLIATRAPSSSALAAIARPIPREAPPISTDIVDKSELH